MFKNIEFPSDDEKVSTIRIKAYYLCATVFGVVILALAMLPVWGIIYTFTNNNQTIATKLWEIFATLVMLRLVIVGSIRLLRLVFAKIVMYEKFFMIEKVMIEYENILSIGLTRKDYSIMGTKNHFVSRSGFAMVFHKEFFLKITNTNMETREYMVGQFEIKDVIKLIEYIKSKNNCEIFDSLEVLNQEYKTRKKANAIFVSIAVIIAIGITTVFLIIEYNDNVRKKILETAKIERNLSDDSLYDLELEIDMVTLTYHSFHLGNKGAIIETSSNIGNLKVGDYLDVPGMDEIIYCLRVEQIVTDGHFSKLYFIGPGLYDIDDITYKSKMKRPLNP